MKKFFYLASMMMVIFCLVFVLQHYNRKQDIIEASVPNEGKTAYSSTTSPQKESQQHQNKLGKKENETLELEAHEPENQILNSDDIDDKTIKNVFAKEIHNKHTITAFKLLQRKFTNSSDSLEDHFEDIRFYLTDLLGSEKAEEILKSYIGFTKYEENLAQQEQIWKRQQPSNIDDALALLEDIQAHRKGIFGDETAEKLFGDEVRRYAYQLRKEDIIRDENESGEAKENRIREMKKELWGKEAAFKDKQTPFARYQEKLRLYKNDLAAMTPEEQLEKRKQFRHVILPPDVARRMDQREENRLALNK